MFFNVAGLFLLSKTNILDPSIRPVDAFCPLIPETDQENNKLGEDVVDALCSLAHALRDNFNIFLSSKDWPDNSVLRLLVIRWMMSRMIFMKLDLMLTDSIVISWWKANRGLKWHWWIREIQELVEAIIFQWPTRSASKSWVFFLQRDLLGTGCACFETLSLLAYSLLAEIIHHVRQDTSLSHAAGLFEFFGCWLPFMLLAALWVFWS